MKSRHTASLLTLFAGFPIRSFSEAISPTPKFTIFNFKFDNVTRFQYLGGLDSSRRSLHASSVEDDFSELGPPVAENAITKLKLVTEKPERFVKTDPASKASVKRSFHSEWNRSLADIVMNFDKSSQTPNSKPDSYHDVPKLDVNEQNSSRIDNSSNMPTENAQDAAECCDADSKVVTIRIQGIGKDTTDPVIHSICKSIGSLEGLAKSDKDAVDALFVIKSAADLESIVKRLNGTIINGCCWLAYQLPRNSTSSAISVNEDVKSKLGLEINSCLIDLKRKLDSMKIDFEDLQLLHLGIMHLEGLPTTGNPSHQD